MSRRLAAVPDAPLRAIKYIRQSKSKDDSISPELQDTAIEDYCARRGYVVVETLIDLDMTGRIWRRRSVEQAVQMIEAGGADVIVTWKWSRVARNRKDWAIAVDRVEASGGRLESATESVDATTSTGRFTRGMLAELAAFESDRIGDVWREVHARRTSSGLPANGKPRFGYRTVDGVHRPDPAEAPVLAALYRRYIGGESMHSLMLWLNREGYRTVPGYSKAGPGLWSHSTLARCLDSGFGAGLMTVRGERVRGAHEPVIDEAAWNTYLAVRDSRRQRGAGERSVYLLSGLVRCGLCGRPMSGGKFGRGLVPKFRCSGATEGWHSGGYAKMEPIEQAVLGWLRDEAADVDSSADAVLARDSFAARRRTDAGLLAREILAAEAALTRLEVNRALEPDAMPEAVHAAARDEILAKLDALQARHRRAVAESAGESPRKMAAQLLADWDVLDVQLRRGMLGRLLDRVMVTPGRPPVTECIPRWGEIAP